MLKVRNKLLILMALLAVGLVATFGISNATMHYDYGSGSTPPAVGPTSGEPDVPASKTSVSMKSMTPEAPADSGRDIVPRGLWVSWAIRIWAATHLGVGL
jgi:hypothetical protein